MKRVKKGFTTGTVFLLDIVLVFSNIAAPPVFLWGKEPVPVSTASTSPEGTEPDSEILAIHTVSELLEFAERCTLDTYSKNMTVSLMSDLNLTGVDFIPIPVFAGVFDGGGHRITGVTIEEKGSVLGFFRYIRQDSIVKNLNLEIQMLPTGSEGKIGGIAGENEGKILRCSVSGRIHGIEEVGGIAGVNRAGGRIEGCISSAKVAGTTRTGGIAGTNEGYIGRCTNEGAVNPEPEEKAEDTGGIAGRSRGEIESCLNYGTIGYRHTGYNTGGIAGLLNGTIRNCENRGTIYGRKDSGGIAGQFEPEISFQYGKDKAEKLKADLKKLSGLITDFVGIIGDSTVDGAEKVQGINEALGLAADSLQAAGDNVENSLESIYGYANELGGALEELLTSADNCIVSVDAELSSAAWELRAVREALDTALRRTGNEISPELDRLAQYRKLLDDQMERIDNGIQAISADFTKVEGFINRVMSILRDDSATASAKASRINEAVKALEKLDFLSPMRQITESFEEMNRILKELLAAIPETKGLEDSELETAIAGFQAQLNVIYTAFSSILTNLDSAGFQIKAILENIGGLAILLSGSVSEIAQAGEVLKSTDFGSSLSKISTATRLIGTYLSDMAESLHRSYNKIDQSLSDGWDTVDRSVQAFGEDMDRFGDALRDFGLSLTDALRTMNEKIGQMEEELYGLSGLNSISADEIYEQLDVVEEHVTGLTDGVMEMNTSLKNAGNEINRQVEQVSNSITELLTAPELTIEDVSDQEEAEQGSGLIRNSRNYATVETDVNAGGIAGIVATEVGLDPEVDLDLSAQGLTDTTAFVKAAIRNCRNDGTISAKNDCAGGIAGRADVGAILDCVSRSVVHVGGKECGGIAGRSGSIIRRSYALCDLEGTESLGGIAGQGKDIQHCYTMARIVSEGEKLGAIAGSANGELTGNYFLKEDLAGVDGINYDGGAMPLTFEELKTVEGIPADFLVFTVIFEENGQAIKSVPVEYDGSVEMSEIPLSTDKETGFHVWPEFETEHIRRSMVISGETRPWITSISTSEEPPLLLVDGTFSPQALVKLTEWKPEENLLPVGKQLIAGYVIEVSNDSAADTYQMRFKCEKGEELYLLEETVMKKAETVRDGSYLIFRSGTNTRLAVLKEENKIKWWMAAAGIGVILAVLLIFLRFFHNRKKKNKKS